MEHFEEKLASSDLIALHMSSSPPAQSDQLEVGALLSSESSSYQVESLLGQGAFGKVVQCTRMSDMKRVAIKMIKDEVYLQEQSEEELVLKKLRSLDPDKCNIVRWYQSFFDMGHYCLEFEELDKNLYDFMKERNFQPLPVKEIRPIVQQIANALDHLSAARIAHADLKPENVMLVNHREEPYRVKVIDFGLARDVSTAKSTTYIQTRYYRSPEVILGAHFTEAIDMWSLGCIAAELFLGDPLYPGNSEYDMIRYIVETQGQPPDHVLNSGFKQGTFFQKDRNSTTTAWKLKTKKKYKKQTGIEPTENRTKKLSSLDDLLHIQVINHNNYEDAAAETADVLLFVEMLKGMLQLDPATRMTPRQVLEHPFISMSYIDNQYRLSSHVRSSVDLMGICQDTQASDSQEAVDLSLQQLCSPGTTQPVLQNLSPPTFSPPRTPRIPTDTRSDSSPPLFLSPHPCTESLDTSPARSGTKRKVDHEDGTPQSKRFRSTWHRKAHQHRSHHHQRSDSDPSPCTSSHVQTDSIQLGTAVRSNSTEPVHPNDSPTSLHQQPDQSCIRPGMKRKISNCKEDDEGQQTNFDQKRKRVRISDEALPTTCSQTRTDHGLMGRRQMMKTPIKRKKRRLDR